MFFIIMITDIDSAIKGFCPSVGDTKIMKLTKTRGHQCLTKGSL